MKAFYTNTRPLFSVIIGTHERTAQLSNCLDTLSRCDPSVSFEVIVVDDGRSAGLGALASTTPLRNKLRVLRQSHAGPGAARNTGAEIAEGLYLVFTADDCLPAPDWLAAYALAFERTPHALLGGSVANGLSSNLFSWANSAVVEYLIAYSTHRDGAPRFFTPNNMAVNRERFLEIGGFDVAMGSTGEDREFCERWHRKGLTLRHCPESIVTHEHPQDLRGFVRQHHSYGRGSCRYYRRMRGPDSARHIRFSPPHPLSFYLRLVTSPFRKEDRPASKMAALLLSQAANAVGYLSERWKGHPPERPQPLRTIELWPAPRDTRATAEMEEHPITDG